MTNPRDADIAITVLIVEDDFMIREAIVGELSDEGFVVHQAGHSAEAIGFLEEHWKATNAMFTDVSMPGEMDGIALAHHVNTHWATVALLVTSALPQARPLPDRARFVGKPYETAQVVKHLRDLTLG